VERLKKVNRNGLFNSTLNFIRSIKEKDRILIVCDDDVDGLCSAIVLKKTLERMGIKRIKTSQTSIYKITKTNFNLRKFSKIIVMDLGIYSLQKDLKELLGRNFLLIDHHPITQKIKSKNVIVINPRENNPEIYQPTSYITYKLCSRLTKIKDMEWVAVLGTLGDYGFDDCKDLIKKYIHIKKKNEIWKTKFGKVAVILSVGISNFGPTFIFDIIKKSKNLSEIFRNKKLRKVYKKHSKFFGSEKKRFWKNVEIFKDIKLIISTTPENEKLIDKSVVSAISSEHLDTIIILIQKVDDVYRANVRYHGGDINLGELLSYSAWGEGGGHRQAAGALIPLNKLSEFKKRFVKRIEELRKST